VVQTLSVADDDIGRMHGVVIRAVLGAGLVLVLVLGACSSSSTTASTDTKDEAPTAPPYPVSVTHLTLTDTTRPTPAGSQTPALPQRSLDTTVFFPDTDVWVEGRFPLVVFSHGLTGSPSRHSDLAEAWARAGFVVALPAFPLTNSTVPGGWSNAADVNNQPADVSFVLDQLIAANDDELSPIFGRIDPERIGVSGHSLGAATTYAITFDACCRDPRVDAAIVMAGVVLVDATAMDYSAATPVLIFHGDADPLLAHQLDVDTYARLSPPKWFVTLLGAGHSPAFEDTESQWDDVVETTSTDFWLGQLDGDAAALARLDADATVPGVSSIQSDPG
jgi:dienelactone hydrolase